MSSTGKTQKSDVAGNAARFDARRHQVKPCDTGIRLLKAVCIRRKGNRDFPYPDEHRLITNPPTLTWPATGYECPDTWPPEPRVLELARFPRYAVRLGRTPTLDDGETRDVTDLPMPFYLPHERLEPGVWYWRYQSNRDGLESGWSGLCQFTVSPDTPLFETPAAADAADRLAVAHPRLPGIRIEDSERPADQEAICSAILGRAHSALARDAESFVCGGEPIPPEADEHRIQQITMFRLKHEITGIANAMRNLVDAFRLTGDERYARKAAELGDVLLEHEPVELYGINDFSASAAMATLSLLYDVWTFSAPAEERRRHEDFIGAVIPAILSHQFAENIGAGEGILAAHFFQHTFLDAFQAAIVMRGHVPGADAWFGLLYEIWLARTPGGGFIEDGSWPNGNVGYHHTNMQSMVAVRELYRRLFEVDLFSHPWYQRCAEGLIYLYPPGSAGDGFGDGCDKPAPPRQLRGEFAHILGRETGSPYASWYARKIAGLADGEAYTFSRDYFREYRLGAAGETGPRSREPHLRMRPAGCGKPAPPEPQGLPQAAVFPQNGVAVMHTALHDTPRNLFVSFYSSPFGSGSHSHPEQNSFNLFHGGKPLFHNTGYRITTKDKHYLLCHKHTRAKNTITINGKGQSFATDGYGWIARFLHGRDISYVMGDASAAYKPFHTSAVNWKTVLEWGDAYNDESGIITGPENDPGVTLFRRHLVMLRPCTVVLYDELEARERATWTWQLNGLEPSNMTLDPLTRRIQVNTDWGCAVAYVYGSVPLRATLSDRYLVPPVDWLNPQRGRPAKEFEARQYHTKTENVAKTDRMRFLAILQVGPSAKAQSATPAADSEGEYHVNGYEIQAELDFAKSARLEVRNPQTGPQLLYGPTQGASWAQGRRFELSTVLKEESTGLRETVDTHPLMVSGKRI